MSFMNGVIVKGIGGFYYVQAEDGHVYECRGRGKFRLDQVTPVAGDHVRFEPTGESRFGYLYEIEERKNYMVRPPIANVDQFLLVLAASTPKPDMLLCDKLLIQAERVGVLAGLVLNKSDEADPFVMDDIRADYQNLPYAFFVTSAKTGEGLNELEQAMENKLSCFSGQSAVGKSSLINALCQSLELETGGLSKKTARGRHTTRASTLLKLEKTRGYVVDTPGFSLLELENLPQEEIQLYYPEMQPFRAQCRFANCMHIAEPGCAVKHMVEEGGIPKERYNRYKTLCQEQQKKQRKKYR